MRWIRICCDRTTAILAGCPQDVQRPSDLLQRIPLRAVNWMAVALGGCLLAVSMVSPSQSRQPEYLALSPTGISWENTGSVWQAIPWESTGEQVAVVDGEEFPKTSRLIVSSLGNPNERFRVTVTLVSNNTDEAETRTPPLPSGWFPIPPVRPWQEPACSRKSAGKLDLPAGPTPPPLWIELHHPGSGGMSSSESRLVKCVLMGRGHRCQIWRPVDETIDSQLEHWCRQLLELVELEVLPIMEADQGRWPDVDGDGITNFLVSDRVSLVGAGVQAFVRKRDFLGVSASANLSGHPAKAPWDVIHVQPSVDFERLKPILFHELTHVAEFSWGCQSQEAQRWPIPDWMTEGFAHATEMRLTTQWENTLPRLQAFAARSQSCPLRVADASHSSLWRDPGQRGVSAAFCDWLIREAGPCPWPDLLRAFSQSENPWEESLGRSFEDLFRDWSISVATHGIPTRGPVGSLKLRVLSLPPDQPVSLVLTGTAIAVFQLEQGADSVTGSQASLRIDAPPGTPLQLTRLRLPD